MGEADRIRGRGAAGNPANRFELIHYARDDDCFTDDDRPSPTTQFLRDKTKSIIATNDSPDVGFEASINPYRGCEHGCIYCYARPTHEYLGFSAGLDFETRIFVKEDASELLRRELASPRWQPKFLAMCGVTDAYQPIERRLQLSRRCLQVLAEFRNPVGVITKNHLVTRDSDVLAELARVNAAAVFLSITTLDPELAGVLEPRASRPEGRLAALRELTAAGVPTGVMVAPVIPGLNDHEMPAILRAARAAGARSAGYVLLRLPHAVSPLFQDWLARHFPDKASRVLTRIRELRGGKMYDSRFRTRQRGEGELANVIEKMFDLAVRQAGLSGLRLELSTAHFRRPNAAPLFDRLEDGNEPGRPELPGP